MRYIGLQWNGNNRNDSPRESITTAKITRVGCCCIPHRFTCRKPLRPSATLVCTGVEVTTVFNRGFLHVSFVCLNRTVVQYTPFSIPYLKSFRSGQPVQFMGTHCPHTSRQHIMLCSFFFFPFSTRYASTLYSIPPTHYLHGISWITELP